MNAELANLAKEIGRIAQSQRGGVEWDKVAGVVLMEGEKQ